MAGTRNSPDGSARGRRDLPQTDPLETRLLQLQIDALRKASDDYEMRLRTLEDSATRFNFLLYLTMGGGLLGVFNLLGLAYLILSAGN